MVTDNLKLIVMKIIEFNGKPNRNFHDILDFAKVGISEISQIPPGEKLGLEKYRKSHLAKSCSLIPQLILTRFTRMVLGISVVFLQLLHLSALFRAPLDLRSPILDMNLPRQNDTGTVQPLCEKTKLGEPWNHQPTLHNAQDMASCVPPQPHFAILRPTPATHDSRSTMARIALV